MDTSTTVSALVDATIEHLQVPLTPQLNELYGIICRSIVGDEVEDPATFLIEKLEADKKSIKPGQTLQSVLFELMKGNVAPEFAPIDANTRTALSVKGGRRKQLGGSRADMVCLLCFAILAAFYGLAGYNLVGRIPTTVSAGIALPILISFLDLLRQRPTIISRGILTGAFLPFVAVNKYFNPVKHLYILDLGEQGLFVAFVYFDKLMDTPLYKENNPYHNDRLSFRIVQSYQNWQGQGQLHSHKEFLRARGYNVDNLVVIDRHVRTNPRFADFTRAELNAYLRSQIPDNQIIENPANLQDRIHQLKYNNQEIGYQQLAFLGAAQNIVETNLRAILATNNGILRRLTALRANILSGPGANEGDIAYFNSIDAPHQVLDQLSYYSKKLRDIKYYIREADEYDPAGRHFDLSMIRLQRLLREPPAGAQALSSYEFAYNNRQNINRCIEFYNSLLHLYRRADNADNDAAKAEVRQINIDIQFNPANCQITNDEDIRNRINALLAEGAGGIPEGRVAASAAVRAALIAFHGSPNVAEPADLAGQEITDPISYDEVPIGTKYAFHVGQPNVYAFSWDYFQNPASNEALFHIANGSIPSLPGAYQPVKSNGTIAVPLKNTWEPIGEFRWTVHTGGVQNIVNAIANFVGRRRRTEVQLLANGAGPAPSAANRRPGSRALPSRRHSNAGLGAAGGGGGGGGGGGFQGGRRTRRHKRAKRRGSRKQN